MKQLVLASQSPRRRELMETLQYPFTVCPAQGEEVMDPSLSPDQLVGGLACQKAEEVSALYPHAVVVGADTVVVLAQQIFGKPKTQDQAYAMLEALQGKRHSVFTGVCVCEKRTGKQETFVQETKVTMGALSHQEILGYLSMGESMDKAGAYGIQGVGAWLMEQVEGDYFNVVGLPLFTLGKVLPRFGIPLFGNEGDI